MGNAAVMIQSNAYRQRIVSARFVRQFHYANCAARLTPYNAPNFLTNHQLPAHHYGSLTVGNKSIWPEPWRILWTAVAPIIKPLWTVTRFHTVISLI